MSRQAAGFDFAQWGPGFDAWQQAAQAHAQAPHAQMPVGSLAWAQWLTPTLDPQEAARRIQELKSVLFWLEQNAAALKASIQALELQQLNCQALQDMQAHWMGQAGGVPTPAPESAAAAAADAATHAAADAQPDAASAPSADALQGAMAQAGQWWASLLHTFGHIVRQTACMQAQGQDPQAPDVEAAPAEGSTASAATTASAKPQAARRAKTGADARARANSSPAAPAPRAAPVQRAAQSAATRRAQDAPRVSAAAKPGGAKTNRSQQKSAPAAAPSAAKAAAPRSTKRASSKRDISRKRA
ncbi:MAG: hypothetical protein Q4A28_01055 [Brachymonas sp.]|nr:hypothetical protein [Brachymonas sp.]